MILKKLQKSIHFKNILAFSLSFSFVTSCIQYRPPPVQKPEVTEWKSEASETGEKLPEKYNRYTAKWWEIFDDPVLNDLQEAALKNSPTIQLQIATLQESRAIWRYVRADQFPQLNLQGNANRTHLAKDAPIGGANTGSSSPSSSSLAPFSLSKSPATTTPTNSSAAAPATAATTATPGLGTTVSPRNISFFQVTPELSYEIDFWGKYWGNSQATLMQAKASEEDVRTAYLQLTTSVAQNYFELKAYDETINIYQKTIVYYQHALDLTAARFTGGIVSAQDPLQAEVTLRTTQAQLEEIIRERAYSENSLATLVGIPASLFEFTSQGFTPKFPVIPAGLPMEILKNRPDVRSAEDQVEAARLFVGVAKTAFYPQISLFGIAGYESNKLHNLFKWKNHVLSITGQLLQTVYDGGRNSAELKRTKAVYRETVSTFINTILNAFEEAENAIFTVTSADREVERREAELAAAEDLLEITTLNYLNGLTTYLDVINAEQSLLQAERDYISSIQERAIATVSLVKALGGVW